MSAEGRFEKVAYEVAGGVATVTLNDPEKRNMLSGQMLTELVAAMKLARDDEEVRAVVLTGAGDKVVLRRRRPRRLRGRCPRWSRNTSPPTSSSSSSG